MKIGLKMRPKDELYIFLYDKDQIYIPSVSRVYGSDFRKISDVSTVQAKSFAYQMAYINFRLECRRTNMATTNTTRYFEHPTGNTTEAETYVTKEVATPPSKIA